MATRTVRRNSLEARSMWDLATSATSYTLDNYFHGKPVTVEGARSWFERVGTRHPIRFDPDTGDYTIHYHGNHWTVLHTRELAS